MWRRSAEIKIKTLALLYRSSATRNNLITRSIVSSSSPSTSATPPPPSFSSTHADKRLKFQDSIPVATGHELEELLAECQGRNILEINCPVGPFGTKVQPAIVNSVYDKRIVGCPGGEGEDEHDVVWFWLEKGKPHECPVCSQYFKLEVVGPGGPPHSHEDHVHH